VISEVTLDATTNAQAAVGWNNDEIASSYVDVGVTTAYELGSFASESPTMNPTIALTTLQAGTMYHSG